MLKQSVARDPDTRDGDPRMRLLLAAEKHFALHGFVGTSLKDIHEAAGQRNTSAIHYHFGSRDGLIHEILEYRVPPRSDRRRAAMAELVGRAVKPTLRELAALWIEQLASELRPRAEGNYYVRFLDQLRRTGPPWARAKAADMQANFGEIFDLIEERMQGIPRRLRRSRLAITAELTIAGLAQLEAGLSTTPLVPSSYPALAISNLIDFVTAGLAAFPAAETIQLEKESASRLDFQFNFSTQY